MDSETSAVEPIRSLVLDDPWLSRAKGGLPHIDFAEHPDFIGTDIGDGAAVQLRDPSGSLVAFGIVDRENQTLRLLPAEDGEHFDENFFRRRIAQASRMRHRLGLSRTDNAYRLINSEGDGLSGFLVDVYAGHVVIYTYAKSFAPWATLLAKAIAIQLEPPSVIAKVRPAGETPTGAVEHVLLHGEEPPRQLVVLEDGVKFEVHLRGGLNTGLFSDMRDVRRALRPWLKGQRVLNTFAYTGSFSLVAALSGAKLVVSVEYAAGVIQWAKTNFQHNDIAPNEQRHRFVKGDVFDYFKAEKRKGREYDVVVLDPPATTPVPGRRWFLKTDYDRLVAHALGVMPSGSLLVAAASSAQSRPEKMENQLRAAGRKMGRRLRLVDSPGLPADFPTQLIYPQSRHLKCYFLLVD